MPFILGFIVFSGAEALKRDFSRQIRTLLFLSFFVMINVLSEGREM